MSKLTREQVEDIGRHLCEENLSGVADRVLAHDAALRTRLTELEAEHSDAWFAMFLSWRGIDSPCKGCGGAGARAYGSTATWRGGIGGQMITTAVCSDCWGSGDANKKWTDLRTLTTRLAKMEAVEKERDYWSGQANHETNKHLTVKQQLATAQARVNELEDLSAQVYQVVGVLASDAGQWDTDATNKVLDNLSMASASRPLPHQDLLPYPCQPVGYDVLTTRCTQMEKALKEARTKLSLYRQASSGEYVGGPEYSYLIRKIDFALTPAAVCQHDWGIDGMHSNEFCKKCFVNRTPAAERTVKDE